jgi:hypothetical protein
MSRMRSSSSEEEERSTTEIFLEGPPCSRTSWQGWREETSEWDPGGGGDPDVTGSGVETLLGGEEPSLKGEQELLLSLLSSIVAKRRREKTLSEKVK